MNTVYAGDWQWHTIVLWPRVVKISLWLCYHPLNRYFKWLPWEYGITLCKNCGHKWTHHILGSHECNYPDRGLRWLNRPRKTKCLCTGWQE